MLSVEVMESHQAETGHRTAKWPIRSAERKRRARVRSRSGYYDKYNVGEKERGVRFDEIPGGDTAFGEDDF